MGTTAPRLSLRQSQSLALTPELRQAIRLLQMPSLELAAHLEDELELNPLLERIDGGTAATGPETAAPDAPAAEAEEEGTGEGWGERMGATTERRPDPPAGRISLRDHLASQIATDVAVPTDRVIATTLLEGLDEAGYLAVGLGEISARLGCPVHRIESVLERLQQLDPPGIFARSLAECLAAQLADRGLLDARMECLLGHLDLVGRGEVDKLSKIIGTDGPGLRRMLASLRRLDPKPGLSFEPTTPETVVPDVLMQPRPGGGWTVELNPQTLPRLIVNRRYHAELLRTARGAEAKTYLAERLTSAKWLVRALDQRARTILKVATEVVRRQDGFFLEGVSRLKPLVLRDVAAAVKLHESTVSRATSNKFMATPRGTFELRYFFATALPGGQPGETVAAEAVKNRIRDLIQAESAEKTLSDDVIVELLRADGIIIARRTVAKYRESMRIPSSVERRRHKALGP